MSNTEQFTGKYEKMSRPVRMLLDRFFGVVFSLIQKDTTSIFEVGCGAGYSTLRLSEAFPDIHIEASDVEDDLVELASKRNPNINIKKESVYELEREDSSVDLVIMLEVLEHLEDPEGALKELARVAKKQVIISVPNEPLWRILNMARGAYLTSFGNTPGHINHWSTRTLSKLVSKYFDINEVRTSLPWIIISLKPKL